MITNLAGGVERIIGSNDVDAVFNRVLYEVHGRYSEDVGGGFHHGIQQ